MVGKSSGSSPKVARGRGKTRRSPRLATPSPSGKSVASTSSTGIKPKPKSPAKRSSSKGRSPSRARKTDPKTPKAKRSPSRKASQSRAAKSPKTTDAGKSPQRAKRSRSAKKSVKKNPYVILDDVSKSRSPSTSKSGIAKYVSLQHFNKIKNKFGGYSDDDDDDIGPSPSGKSGGGGGKQLRSSSASSGGDKSRKNKSPSIAAIVGAFAMMVSAPIILIGLYIFCSESPCVFNKLPKLGKYATVATYYDAKSYVGYVAYVCTVIVCSAIPCIGKQVEAVIKPRFTYKMNGIATYCIITACIIGLEFKGIRINEYIVAHIFQLLTVALIVGVIVTTFAYVKSFYAPLVALNTDGIGKSRIVNYFIGRELNPRLFRTIDMKMCALRVAFIGSIILEFAYLYKSVGPLSSIAAIKVNSINPTLALSVIFHVVYAAGVLVHEPGLVSTFLIQSEAFGYNTGVGAGIFPFISVLITKYVYDYGVHLSKATLIIVAIIYAIGYVLQRHSSNLKAAFRKNPYNPALSHLETIPTSQGKKLIASGVWGIVRHPNYTGIILIHCAYIPFVVCAPPIISVIIGIVATVVRSKMDHNKCKKKYGSAWDRYCNKVKYVLFFKIY